MPSLPWEAFIIYFLKYSLAVEILFYFIINKIIKILAFTLYFYMSSSLSNWLVSDSSSFDKEKHIEGDLLLSYSRSTRSSLFILKLSPCKAKVNLVLRTKIITSSSIACFYSIALTKDNKFYLCSINDFSGSESIYFLNFKIIPIFS